MSQTLKRQPRETVLYQTFQIRILQIHYTNRKSENLQISRLIDEIYKIFTVITFVPYRLKGVYTFDITTKGTDTCISNCDVG